MTPSSRALIWELWRRNRWGFGLLVGLFLLCWGLRLYIDYLGSQVAVLQGEFLQRTQGTLELSELLPRPEGQAIESHGTIQAGETGYTGPLRPGQQLSWSGSLVGAGLALIHLSLDNLELCASQPLPARITINVAGGSQRTINFLAAQEDADRAGGLASKREIWQVAARGWSIVCLGFSVLVLFAAFAAVEPHGARGFTGIPPRRLTLPVSTGALVFWPVTLGAGAMLVTCGLWFGLVLSGLVSDNMPIPYYFLTGLFMAGLVLFQTLVWGCPSFPKARVALISIVLFAILALAVQPFSGSTKLASWWTEAQVEATAILGLVWVFGLAAAFIGASWERRGRWAGAAMWLRQDLGSLGILRRAKSTCFFSPEQAQFWIEWRRNARVALVVWAMLLGVIYGCDIGARLFWSELRPLASGLVDLLPLLAAGWLSVTGLNMARDGVNRKLALSSFTATRPISTGFLLRSKVRAGLTLWAVAALFFAVAWSADAVVASPWSTSDVSRFDLVVAGAVIAALSLHLLVGILPLTVSGRVLGFPWSLLPLLLVYGIVINVLMWFERRRLPEEIVVALLGLLLATKLLVAFWGFRRVLQQRIASGAFVFRSVAFWLVAALLMLWLAWSVAEAEHWADLSIAMLPAAVLIVPLARLALAPLALQMNRHR